MNYGVGSPFDNNQIVLSDFLSSLLAGDFDEDDDVDGNDFLIWQSQFGAASGGGAVAVVPEPTTGVLVGLFLLIRLAFGLLIRTRIGLFA